MTAHQTERRIQTVCLLVLAAVAVGMAMFWLRAVMVPFVLALFFAFILTPIMDFQIRRWRTPRTVAMVGTLLIGVLMLCLLGMLISASVAQMLQHREDYQQRFTELVERVGETLPLELLGLETDEVSTGSESGEVAPGAVGKATIRPDVPDEVAADRPGDVPGLMGADTGVTVPVGSFDPSALIPPGMVRGFLVGTTNAIMSLLSQGVLVMIFLIFLLIGHGANEVVPGGVWAEVQGQVRRYVATKMLTSAVTGILVWLTLAILGVDFAMVFGVFAFLLNFIPSLGSIISTLLPVPVVLVSPDISITVAILAVAIPGAIQFTVGNLIEPKIMGQSLDLHPVLILLALIFWGTIWGLVGMLLAAPITGILRIMMQRIEITRPVADLMAGRLPQRDPAGD